MSLTSVANIRETAKQAACLAVIEASLLNLKCLYISGLCGRMRLALATHWKGRGFLL